MRRVIAACVVVLLVAACSAPQKERERLDIDGHGGSTPSASTGTYLDHIPPEPERPDDQHDEDGAVAFAGYLFEVVYYAYGQGERGPLESIADVASCTGCLTVLDNISTMAARGYVMVGTSPIDAHDATVTSFDDQFATVRLVVTYPETALIQGSDGAVVDGPSASSESVMNVNLRWDDEAWTVFDFSEVPS